MKSREVWFNVMKVHLLPAFGEFFIDTIRRQDVEEWFDGEAKRVESGEYSPVTANNWLRTLKVIMSAATKEFEWQRDPAAGIEYLDTSTHATYTEEQPNSLSPGEASRFLSLVRERHPQHFAMVALGIATGLRPSSLRPLRRRGPRTDVLWNENVLLVRQSQTRGPEIMECTKQGTRYRLTLPRELMDILRWHVEQLPEGPMSDSDLLFPGKQGGFRTGVDPIWWTPTLSKTGVEKVPHVEAEGSATSATGAHARVQGRSGETGEGGRPQGGRAISGPWPRRQPGSVLGTPG
jgi:integrase